MNTYRLARFTFLSLSEALDIAARAPRAMTVTLPVWRYRRRD